MHATTVVLRNDAMLKMYISKRCVGVLDAFARATVQLILLLLLLIDAGF
jgi:hypothetical protein